MSPSSTMLLMAAIFIAPNLSTTSRIVASMASLAFALITRFA